MSGPKNTTKKANKDNLDMVEQEAVKLERVLDFDLYFRLKMNKDSKILAHHKAPMKAFAEAAGLTQATESKFDEIFKTY